MTGFTQCLGCASPACVYAEACQFPKSVGAVAMKERPILFSGPMVRALLDGRKTQTRRTVKRVALECLDRGMDPAVVTRSSVSGRPLCPYGVPGDVLWVKETWQAQEAFDHQSPSQIGEDWADEYDDPGVAPVRYLADGKRRGSVELWRQGSPGKTRVSIHMPRWACRLTLRITDVRVERLNDCSEADAEAEGVQDPSLVPILGAFWSSRDGYARLWEHINGPDSWAANPWVWAVSFEVVK